MILPQRRKDIIRSAMSEAAIKPPVRKPRPKYLNLQALLFEIRLPIAGRMSILHRVSGALLFLAMVWLLWMLALSLSSEASFLKIKHYIHLWPVKLGLLGLFWASEQHTRLELIEQLNAELQELRRRNRNND